jgi:hypothetical protein
MNLNLKQPIFSLHTFDQGSARFPKIMEQLPNSERKWQYLASSILRTHNSGLTFERHCYQAFYAVCTCTDTHTCV